MQLAGERDPVEAVSERARALVLKALDSGWAGPPFDPFTLADLLGIEIVPKHEVGDARTVPVGRSGFRIEFNPARPRGRLRYSIAHEIAHTLFPDCAEQARYRVSRDEMAEDEWQLESLCNLAAAEFLMPIGSFPELREEGLGIRNLLVLQNTFAVSMEALLIRVARLADHPCAMFAASRIERGTGKGRYRLEYAVESASWAGRLLSGTILPESSAVAECVAIGFTAEGLERWAGWSEGRRVECVGLPPYPGSRFPRAAGIVLPPSSDDEPTPTIQYLIGDATEPRSRPALIVQIVNDATPNWGGRGFARAVRTRWPEVQQSFRAFVEKERLRLGKVHLARPDADVWLMSIVAQKGYGPSPTHRVRYAALRKGLRAAARYSHELGASVHMPRIGCGEGGGDWTIVAELIRAELIRQDVPVTVYDLPGSSVPTQDQVSFDFSPN